MNFSLYIAKRYIRSKSSQSAVNIINFITFLVTVIGSAALFIVLSGFAGLKTFSLSFSVSFDPDLKAVPISGKFFSISEIQEREIEKIAGVISYTKELEEQVYLTHKQKSFLAYIKGIDANYSNVIATDSIIYFGEWNTTQNQAVVGFGIASKLGLYINNYRNPLQILALKPSKGSFSLKGKLPYNQLPLIVSGIFSIEENLDKKYVFADLPLVQALLEKDNDQVSGIGFKISETSDLDEIRSKLTRIFDYEVHIKNREQLNDTLYKMLNTENMATYLIFTLVLIIALFNVVGAIIMMILDKSQNSKTLYFLGATIDELRRIYFVQGVLVTAAAGFIGIAFASVLIWSQIVFGWLKITATLAYPVEYKLINVFIVLATIIVLGIIASKIASVKLSAKLWLSRNYFLDFIIK